MTGGPMKWGGVGRVLSGTLALVIVLSGTGTAVVPVAAGSGLAPGPGPPVGTPEGPDVGGDAPGDAVRTNDGEIGDPRAASLDAEPGRTALSFESGTPGDLQPPEPWFLLGDPRNVDRNDVAELSDTRASDGRLSMHIGSYDPEELNRIRVGVLVDLDRVETVAYDGYVEANNPNWGDIKLNVGSETVSSDLVANDPPDDRWYRDVTADVSGYEGTHLLYFWVRGDENDAYIDNVRFRNAAGERVPVSRVVAPVTEFTFDPLRSHSLTSTDLRFPEATIGLHDPHAAADARVNATAGTSRIAVSAGADGVVAVGTGAEGALGRTRLGFACKASRDGPYVVSSAYTTEGELGYFRGGSGGVSAVRTGVTSNLTVLTDEYPPDTLGTAKRIERDILSPASVFDPATDWNVLLPVIESFVDSYVGLPVTDAASVVGVDFRTSTSGSATIDDERSLAVSFDARRGQEYAIGHVTTAGSIAVMHDLDVFGTPEADSHAAVDQRVRLRIAGDHPCNRPVTASAGPDATVTAGSVVTLNGSATDPDNPLPFGATPRPFSWEQVAGPAVDLRHPHARHAEFTAPDVDDPTTLTFAFTATDAALRQHPLPDTDRVNVTVVPAGGEDEDEEEGVDGTETSLSLRPSDRRVVPGGSASYDVVVGTVSDGVGSYELAVDLADPATAVVTGATNRIGGTARIEVTEDNSSVRIGAFAGDTVDDGRNVTVATVTVVGVSPGTTGLSLDVTSVGDERGGDRYAVEDTTGATVTVGERRAPDVTDDGNAARDPDGDGVYEDVNGDGDVTPGDATVLFDAVFEGDPAVTANVALFDFSGDGSLAPGDATVLFEEALG